jgi:uncharacterized membrane protein
MHLLCAWRVDGNIATLVALRSMLPVHRDKAEAILFLCPIFALLIQITE